MKLRKLATLGVALTMAASMAVPAFAATDGTEAGSPYGSGGADSSNGGASITSVGGENWETTGDDDNIAATEDTTGADINVWAQVLNEGEDTYKVDIGWGAMKFQFNAGQGTWDTSKHEYTGDVGAKWTVDGYLDGENNKVTVTNHSNKAVDASFAYAMDAQNLFNPTGTEDTVRGNFFDSNAKAEAAALVLNTSSGTIADVLAGAVPLHSADAYIDAANGNNSVQAALATDAGGAEDDWALTGRSDDVFFAFSGTPDAGTSTTLNDFKKVGVITVTVAPKANLTGFEG